MKQFFKRFAPYMGGYKLYFFYAILGTAMVAGASGASAYLVKPVLDEIFINKDVAMLAILPWLVVLAYFCKGFGGYIQTYFMNYIGQDIVRRVRDELLGRMLSFEMTFFNRRRTGELISRVVNDINAIQSAVSTYFADYVKEGLTIVVLVGVVIYQSPELAFYGLVVMPLALYPLTLLAKKMKKVSKRTQEKNSDVTSRLAEIFNNVELIKSNSGERFEVTSFAKENRKLFDLNMKSVRVSELTSPLMETLGALAVAVVIVVGGHQVIDEKLTVGSFFSFMTALFMLYTPIKRLSGIYNKMQSAVAAGERIFEMMEREPLIKDGEKELEGKIESLEFKEVGLLYEEKRALEGISFTLKKGESLALVGDSGGGKSSLVSLILRLYEASEGEVLINQEKIRHLTQKSLRSRIAIVTQRIFIFNDTIAHNVAYGEAVDRERVKEALQKARAWDFVETLEEGIDTILDEFGANLSGGQRQRIAIARAIYKNPDILILDEATSALDNKTETEFKEALAEIMRDKITLIVAHRPSTVSLAQKIALLKEGKILAIGTQEELVQYSPEFTKIFHQPLG
ncbi:ABC transporter ATP-binding protein [Wolinella succinogenes]|uniref:MULTIDRUG RESISTANCE PROTEIN MSBA n=1 Tax=Wolinella succinogenes (strain ATCC 29543 / DSM 1740 / CCUG 13145 / JCM 31913 / LMG 7466 / NCTC 11488 / FDC 602W) TaxID=273121 RepID=Q7MAG9_WOLSU|nr:ABC transporter ATP-binding protein [Wolinella succinogenes]CAE09411.1 MULTIDRUG RESISTANCE PROTEIN MSBA [Wolinella succinogenes]VEG81624.1 Lipid A export ATP-binding/permease protein MsbA [Wolinella succinogenes]HCZ18935.1 ABC transporter ATP-binding protein [Helicobacter sp.]